MKARSILTSTLWLLLSWKCKTTPVEQDTSPGKARIDFQPGSYLYFEGDDVPKDGPEKMAPGNSPSLYEMAETSLSKRGGTLAVPKIWWQDRSRGDMYRRASHRPPGSIIHYMDYRAKQFLKQIEHYIHDPDRSPAFEGLEVRYMKYTMRIMWNRVSSAVEFPDSRGRSLRWAWPDDVPSPTQCTVYQYVPIGHAPTLNLWLTARLMDPATGVDGMAGAVITNNEGFAFAYQILSDEEWRRAEEDIAIQQAWGYDIRLTQWGAPLLFSLPPAPGVEHPPLLPDPQDPAPSPASPAAPSPSDGDQIRQLSAPAPDSAPPGLDAFIGASLLFSLYTMMFAGPME
ncbi:MAG: hypothetical protein M1831_000233 [Alyxoria varia]|nr:MAG: hypothetical protein M1831_000233 [Alyxoria varia]